jgi:hypothetical protein
MNRFITNLIFGLLKLLFSKVNFIIIIRLITSFILTLISINFLINIKVNHFFQLIDLIFIKFFYNFDLSIHFYFI